MKQHKQALGRRDRRIVNLLKQNKYTLQDVSDLYGLSVERVREIYKNLTGENSYNGYNIFLSKKRKAKEIKEAESVKFYCKVCGSKVLKKEGGTKYCVPCRAIEIGTNRSAETYKCPVCSKLFHPHKVSLRNRFIGTCSRECGSLLSAIKKRSPTCVCGAKPSITSRGLCKSCYLHLKYHASKKIFETNNETK